ncbi:MAG: glycosyltransferase family 4 protein [Candidatus Hydrogenedentota bacterium]
MRILQVQGNSGFGGSEISTYLLSKGLKERGIEVVVVIQPGGPVTEELRQIGIKTYEIDLLNKWNFGSTFKLINVIKKDDVDIIHSHLRNADYHSYLSTIFHKKLPLITTIHDFLFLDKNGCVDSGLYTRIYKRILENNFEFIVTISESIRKDSLEKLNIKEDKLINIYNCIDTTMFNKFSDQDDKTWKAKINWDENYQYIGFIGRMTRQKGHLFYLKAFREVLKKHHRTKTVLIGDGPLKKEIDSLINRDDLLKNNVITLGYQRNFYALYKIFDVVVIPSLWEAFGRVALESLICGTPVVASCTGGLKEIINDGQNGYLFKPQDVADCADKICKVLKDRCLKDIMGQNGVKTVIEKYDLPRFISEHIKIYEKVML